MIAEYLQKIDPKSDGAKRDWVAIYDECANVLYQVVLTPVNLPHSEMTLEAVKFKICLSVSRVIFSLPLIVCVVSSFFSFTFSFLLPFAFIFFPSNFVQLKMRVLLVVPCFHLLARIIWN